VVPDIARHAKCRSLAKLWERVFNALVKAARQAIAAPSQMRQGIAASYNRLVCSHRHAIPYFERFISFVEIGAARALHSGVWIL
jgi:hypothetical protein